MKIIGVRCFLFFFGLEKKELVFTAHMDFFAAIDGEK